MNTKLIIALIVLIIGIGAVAFFINKNETTDVVNEPVVTFTETEPTPDPVVNVETETEINEPVLNTEAPEFPKTGKNPE